MKENLGDLEFLSTLEGLLAQESERLESLKGRKLDFGPKLSQSELEKSLMDVKQKVDTFMGVENINIPNLRLGYNLMYKGLIWLSSAISLTIVYFSKGIANKLEIPETYVALSAGAIACLSSFLIGSIVNPNTHLFSSYYHSKKKHIQISQDDLLMAIAIPTLAHEYAHYVLDMQKEKEDIATIGTGVPSLIIEEGIPKIVEGRIAKLYAEAENNPAFLYGTTKRTVSQLKNLYLYLCLSFHKEPNKNLFMKRELLESKINKMLEHMPILGKIASKDIYYIRVYGYGSVVYLTIQQNSN